MVWHVGHLNQRDELGTKLSHTLLHGFLHGAVGAWSKEARVENGSTVLKQLFEAVDLSNELE